MKTAGGVPRTLCAACWTKADAGPSGCLHLHIHLHKSDNDDDILVVEKELVEQLVEKVSETDEDAEAGHI